eukprot:m51a1_g8718 hypothetical protein (938) ;mRNA; r:164319-168139
MRPTVLAFLLFFAALHGVAVYYFASGFLLTRYEVPQRHTHCAACSSARRFDKAVILLIDALRFDFVWSSVENRSDGYPYGKLASLRELHEAHAATTLVYEALADPPTTTMQRLKALTTGALPTFVDVGKSFASGAVDVDNVVERLGAAGRRVVVMGDDTWLSLFEQRSFARSYPFASFNVKDLHSVDRGVLGQLYPELRGERGPWDVVVAHFLGVDHAGHRYGPHHPEMAAKLAQMSDVVANVSAMLGEDTLLIVLGDHGMTEDGNHGGGTHDEARTPRDPNSIDFAHFKIVLSSAMVLHWKAPKELCSGEAWQQAQQARSAAVPSSPNPWRTIAQIDLVPTLSLLLGVPIPFGNIGSVVPEPFLFPAGPADTRAQMLARLLRAREQNTKQVSKYLDEYSKLVPSFPLGKLAAALEETRDTGVSTERQIAAHREYLEAVSAVCREAWATFDLGKMLLGCVIGLATLLGMCFHLFHGLDVFPMFSVSKGLVAGGISAYMIPKHLSSLAPVAAVTALGAAIGFAIASVRLTLATLRHARFRRAALVSGAIAAACVAVRGASLFSNSFIEADEHVVHYLICSLLVAFAASRPSVANASRVAVALLVGRVSLARSVRARQRHEGLSESPALDVLLDVALPIALLVALVPRVLWRWAESTVARPSGLLLAARLCCLAGTVLCGAFWSLLKLGALDSLPTLARVALPQLVFASSALCVALCLVAAMRSRGSYYRGTRPACYATLVAGVGVGVALAMGPHSPWVLLAVAVQGCLTAQLLRPEGSDSAPLALLGVLWALLGLQAFFASGHTYSFSDIQFESAFVGVESANIAVGAVLVTLNTVGALLLVALALPVAALYVGARVVDGVPTSMPEFVGAVSRVLVAFVLVFAADCALTVAFVYAERRHLMVWRVFSPKLVFDSALLATADVSAVAAYALGWLTFLA